MADAVYVLCASTSLICAVLLLRRYLAVRSKLLLWSSLCFIGLSINNLLLVADRVLLAGRDLSSLRAATALASIALLLFGLIWESQ